MMSNQWKPLIKKQAHPIAKNKHLEAILVTDDNAKAIAEETDAFTVMDNGRLLTGFMSFQRAPIWMIALNPTSSKTKKYIFESVHVFDDYFDIDDKI